MYKGIFVPPYLTKTGSQHIILQSKAVRKRSIPGSELQREGGSVRALGEAGGKWLPSSGLKDSRVQRFPPLPGSSVDAVRPNSGGTTDFVSVRPEPMAPGVFLFLEEKSCQK